MKSKVVWTTAASILIVWIAVKFWWAPPADLVAAARAAISGLLVASFFFVFAAFLRDSLHDTRLPF